MPSSTAMSQNSVCAVLDIDNENAESVPLETETTKVAPFRLMALPPELRAAILEFVLKEDELLKITPDLHPPPLAEVSRQIRKEALDVWYRCNLFCTEIKYDRRTDFRRKFEQHLNKLGAFPAIAKWIHLEGEQVQSEERMMHRFEWRLYRREEHMKIVAKSNFEIEDSWDNLW